MTKREIINLFTILAIGIVMGFTVPADASMWYLAGVIVGGFSALLAMW